MDRDRKDSDASIADQIVPFGRAEAWRFWVAVSILTAAEAAALLEGLRLAPHTNGLLGYMMGPTMFSGWWLEAYLMMMRGKWVVSERQPLGPMSRAMSRGTMYVVPPVYGSAGFVFGWAAFLSVLVFAGLMFRVWWIWQKRIPADRLIRSEQLPEA